MAYTPNPFDQSQPIDAVFAGTAAAEFRALKGSMIALQAALVADSTLFLGAWSAQTGAAVLGNIVIHNGKAWMAVVAIADITTAEPGVSASWLPIGTYQSPLDNLVLNGNFARNTRGVSGSIVLAAGQLGHDMWYAGAGGCTYTVAGGVVTITAGTLKTAIWGQRIGTADHTASHSGTASFSVNGGASTAGAKTVALVAGANCVLEFSIGTIREVSLSLGKAVQPFIPYPPELQDVLVDYYVRTQYVLIGGGNSREWMSVRSSSGINRPETPIGPMRTVPSVTMVNNSSIEYLNASSVWTATTLSVAAYGVPSALLLRVTAPADATGTGVTVRRNAAGDVSAILSAELTP